VLSTVLLAFHIELEQFLFALLFGFNRERKGGDNAVFCLGLLVRILETRTGASPRKGRDRRLFKIWNAIRSVAPTGVEWARHTLLRLRIPEHTQLRKKLRPIESLPIDDLPV
jgi:hypothetical protein